MDIIKATQPRMNAGWFESLVEEFRISLVKQGYASLTVDNFMGSARHFAVWLGGTQADLCKINAVSVERFARHRCKCAGRQVRLTRVSSQYAVQAKRFIMFLVERKLVSPLPKLPAPPVEPLILAYQRWQRVHRGLSEKTIARDGRELIQLLAALGSDPVAYNAAMLRDFACAEVQRSSSGHLSTVLGVLRGYLRFLAAQGFCDVGLDRAVPSIPRWRLSSLPRYLGSDDIEKLISSCGSLRQALRDRAILLLLARLGLRAGDIISMQLEDLDWESGTLLVRGKARREVRLPLPQEVGDALLAYIDQERPDSSDHHLFLISVAPFNPLPRSCNVSNIVRQALDRADIQNAPSKGAHLLRHSAATAMLRAGATLEAVGTVLRHQSLDMTMYYAKVDFTMLERVIQPWPGGASC